MASKYPLAPAGLTLLATMAVVLAPVLPAPARLALGRACSEAPVHLWGLWVAADGIWSHGPLLRDAAVGFPGHFRHHHIDPLHLLEMIPATVFVGGPAGAVLGWNLVHLVAMGLGGLGCVWLGRRLELSGWPLAVLVASVTGSPALMQHPELGRTEYLPALCLPLVLVGLWDACHSARWRRGWLAGGLLAAVTMSGPTLALFAGPFVAAVGLWWSRPLSRVQRLRVLGSVLVPGVLGSAVAAVALWAWPPPLAPDLFTGASRELVQSVELAALVRLAPGTRELEMTPYLGLVGLPLALFGLVRRPGVLGFWAASVVALIAVGVGPYPTVFGQLLAGPTWVITELVPPLRAVSGWPRVAWVMAIPMGVCAAIGLQALGPRARLLGPFVVLGLCLDHATFPGPRFETRRTAVFSGAPPASVVTVVDALPVGPIFTLPAATPAVGKQCVMDSPWVVWSASLARPVTANQGRPTDGMATGSGFAAAVVRSPERLAAQLARDGVSDACALAAVQELSEAGITGVVVETTLVRGRATRSAVEAVLGRPHFETGATVGWSLEQVQSAAPVAGEACERRWVGGFPRD